MLIIGSGATAITLVPAMVERWCSACHYATTLTDLYSFCACNGLLFISKMRKVLPEDIAYKITRARNIGMQRAIYVLAQKQPKLLRRLCY